MTEIAGQAIEEATTMRTGEDTHLIKPSYSTSGVISLPYLSCAFVKSKTYSIVAIETNIELWAKYIPGHILAPIHSDKADGYEQHTTDLLPKPNPMIAGSSYRWRARSFPEASRKRSGLKR